MKQGPSTDVRLPGEAIPLIVFQGDRDQTVDRVNGDRLIDQWGTVTRNGRSAHVTAGAARTRHEGIVAGGRSYTQLSYPAAGARPAMEQWIVHGGGHAWSGGGPQGSYTDASGPDASPKWHASSVSMLGEWLGQSVGWLSPTSVRRTLNSYSAALPR